LRRQGRMKAVRIPANLLAIHAPTARVARQ
jgi:hypothetical protein